jgi:very-short-patch-repair endonuclease
MSLTEAGILPYFPYLKIGGTQTIHPPPFSVLENGGGRRGQETDPMQKPKLTTPKIMRRAGELRHEQTPAEAKLWAYLRAHRANAVGFRRQHAIGSYIVDFYALSRKLVIEVDGSQHLDQQEYDTERTAFLQAQGYTILRFWNGDVMNNIEGVLGVILEEISPTGIITEEEEIKIVEEK